MEKAESEDSPGHEARCGGFSGSSEKEKGVFEYFGRVYHLGVNNIGREYCHHRFLSVRGNHVEMYKRDPRENPGLKPIRKGFVGPTLKVEELGQRRVHRGDLYVLRFYNKLDEAKKGEIACDTAEEAEKWIEAFQHAKRQADFAVSRGGSARIKLNVEQEINLEGHRPRVRRYAHGLKKLIKIAQCQGPEMLARQTSGLALCGYSDNYYGDFGDAVDAHEWKCVRTINGVRIFEDVSDSKCGKGVLVKAAAVIDANTDTVFDVILTLDRQRRYEWDMLTGDLELIDSYDGNYDVVYATYEPNSLTRWHKKQDFVFSRQWFHGQDGTYTILLFPAAHKKKPPFSGYRRTKINPSTWEIRSLNNQRGSPKSLVTQILEIPSSRWYAWKNNTSSKFEKTIPYALLCQVSGLKEYIEATPAVNGGTSRTSLHSPDQNVSITNHQFEETEVKDEFYDAIAEDSSSSDEESEDDEEFQDEESNLKLKIVAPFPSSSDLMETSDPNVNKELDTNVDPISADPTQFCGSLEKGKEENDTNCWTSPSGTGFMIRGKRYLQDNSKVNGGDPLLKLLAVDWLKVDKTTDNIAMNPKCPVQSESGKNLPFVLVLNLQIPAKPNYSLVLYYAAERPVNKDSLLGKFIDGDDAFRNSRFKLIPSIVEGYWMVKRAVGTKACLMGKAVTCKYSRDKNFLEIDVDVGSSSVARSVVGLVLGYVTSIVVDLAILLEAKEEEELPEYILGTVRLNRVRLDSAIRLDD